MPSQQGAGTCERLKQALGSVDRYMAHTCQDAPVHGIFSFGGVHSGAQALQLLHSLIRCSGAIVVALRGGLVMSVSLFLLLLHGPALYTLRSVRCSAQ